MSGRVAAMCAAFRSPSSRAASRLDQVVDAGAAAADVLLGQRQQLDAGNRAQQIARRLRARPARARGGRHRDTRRAARAGAAPLAAARARQTTSLTSRTRAENARARVGPLRDRRRAAAPYSFIDDPQPAALTAIRSTPARSNTSIVRRAKARASSSRPACSASAPQHPARPARRRRTLRPPAR